MKKKIHNVEEIIVCPECGGTRISSDYARAELVCTDCGLVIADNLIDHGPEWRAFDKEQRQKKGANWGTDDVHHA